jgi:septum formation protein
MRFYLASQSPRRKQLLTRLGLSFEVLLAPIDIDMEALEEMRPNEAPATYVKRVTLAKLKQARQQTKANDAVLCADTTVCLGRIIFGKPKTALNNAQILTMLQGKTHRVLTAVALYAGGNTFQTLSTSYVTFAALSNTEIEHYALSGEGWDKAGGYAIQGNAATFVTHLRGDYTGIMGLPLHPTRLLLKQSGLLASD